MEDQISATESAIPVTGAAEGDFAGAAAGVVPPKKKKRHINQQKLQDNLWGWIFCIPLIVGTVWFVYSALIMAIMLSFTNYHLTDGTLMEVLGNLGDHLYKSGGEIDPETGLPFGEKVVDAFFWYKQIFTKTYNPFTDSLVTEPLKANETGRYFFNTVFYMIGIPIGMILAMFLAVCMSRDIKGGNFFRVLYYVPCVASTISIVFTFRLMFSKEGVINGLFNTDIDWLFGTSSWNNMQNKSSTSLFMRDPYWCSGFLTKMVIVIMSVWKGLGGTIILYIAGLSGVNAATKEAAQIDGANGWKIFWKVTMPDLYPVIFYNIVTAVIGGLQIYAEPELLSGSSSAGGSNALTSGYVALVFKYGVDDGTGTTSPGAGAAYGLFLGVIILILTLFQFWLDGRKKD